MTVVDRVVFHLLRLDVYWVRLAGQAHLGLWRAACAVLVLGLDS